ncbi:unnamed protein product [Ceutorhynchus assimilis]|uniref:NADP-dependent oxidoreductase domain-containing protein n=1 Tax=Ceutorhynchus assimilis TaxID=467358 RepID=A0A9N9MHZ5_9CUCU|nr:unnamed protein product [Ceutorhynchus assimilis]
MAVPAFTLTNGHKLPLVGLGTFTVTDENDLNEALEAGYRHFDTAAAYKNEHVIGQVLKSWFDSGKLKREDVFVTTKLNSDGVHPDLVEEHILKSLEQLQLDYIDLYLIHFPIYVKLEFVSGKALSAAEAQPTDHIAIWRKLEEQVELGRTKAIGVSNFNKDQVSRIVEVAKIRPAANEFELHVYLQQPELVKYLKANGILPISYFSLGNPGINNYLAKQGRPLRKTPTDLIDDPVVTKIASKHGKSSGQVLLKFLVQNNIAVIPKSSNPKRLRENLSLFDFTLDDEDVKLLTGLDKGEQGRRATMAYSQSVLDHPEYPFPRVPRDV